MEEQASKRMSAVERASEVSSTKQAVRRERMSECCKQTSEQRNKWPSSQRINFIVSQPTARRRHNKTETHPFSWKKTRFDVFHFFVPLVLDPINFLMNPKCLVRNFGTTRFARPWFFFQSWSVCAFFRFYFTYRWQLTLRSIFVSLRLHYGSKQPKIGSSILTLSHKLESERSGAHEQREQCGAGEWVSGASEWASGRASGPVVKFR